MANSYNTQDVVKGALQRAGEVTDGSSSYHQLALKYVNDIHRDIVKSNSIFDPDLREPWTWARKTASGIYPAFTAINASMVNGSAAGTFLTTPSVSYQGFFFSANPAGTQNLTVYKILQHTAGMTSFTLDTIFLEPTNPSLNAAVLPLIVDLGKGIQRLVEPFRIYVNRVLEFGETSADMGRIYGMDPIEFWKEFPLQLIINDVPSKFTTIFRSETSWQVQFNKYVSNPIRFDYDYIPIPADLTDDTTSVPLIPRDDRSVLETGAAYYLYLDKKQKEDAATYFTATAAKIKAMKESERSNSKFYGSIYGQLVPRRDDSAIPYWVIQK